MNVYRIDRRQDGEFWTVGFYAPDANAGVRVHSNDSSSNPYFLAYVTPLGVNIGHVISGKPAAPATDVATKMPNFEGLVSLLHAIGRHDWESVSMLEPAVRQQMPAYSQGYLCDKVHSQRSN